MAAARGIAGLSARVLKLQVLRCKEKSFYSNIQSGGNANFH